LGVSIKIAEACHSSSACVSGSLFAFFEPCKVLALFFRAMGRELVTFMESLRRLWCIKFARLKIEREAFCWLWFIVFMEYTHSFVVSN